MQDLAHVSQLVRSLRIAAAIDAVGGRPGVDALAASDDPEAFELGVHLLHYAGDDVSAERAPRQRLRRHPTDAVALTLVVRDRVHDVDGLRGLLTLERYADRMRDPAPRERARWLCLEARARGALRDFARARSALSDARRIAPDDRWVWSTEVGLLLEEDRPEDALECAREGAARKIAPTSEGWLVYVLTRCGRREEALDLARRYTNEVEDRLAAMTAADLCVELGDRTEGLGFLDIAERYAPFADRYLSESIRIRRLEWAFLDGDLDRAEALCVAAGRRAVGGAERYEARVLEALRDPVKRAAPRRVLEVPFVPQDHATCSPAMLAALAGAWTVPADHDEIVREICLYGTPEVLTRGWARSRGWTAVEFVPDFDAVRRLIDAGIPFGLHTYGVGSAHSQTVMGYDARTRSVVIREPSIPRWIESVVEPRDGAMPASSFRAIAMVPPGSAAHDVLATLALPRRDEYDVRYEIEQAWEAKNLQSAAKALASMQARFGDSDLTCLATADEAARRDDDEAELAAIASLVDRYPNDDILGLRCERILQRLGRSEEAQVILDRLTSHPHAAPGCHLDRAWVLGVRGAPLRASLRAVLRALHAGHPPHECAAIVSGLFVRSPGDERQALASFELYRLQACYRPLHREAAQSWISVARRLRRVPEVLDFLRDAADRSNERDGEPIYSYLGALQAAGQLDVAVAYVEAASAKRPNDGGLLLERAYYLLCAERIGPAHQALVDAESRADRLQWLRLAAQIEARRGRRREAIARWRELLTLEPLSRYALEGLANLAADAGAREDAVSELVAIFNERPSHPGIAATLARALHRHDPGRTAEILKRHAEASPTSRWVWPKLASAYLAMGDLELARRAADEGVRRDPTCEESWMLVARIAETKGDIPAAIEAATRAYDLDLDDQAALSTALRLLPDDDARAAFLRRRWSSLEHRAATADELDSLVHASVQALGIEETQRRLEPHASAPDAPLPLRLLAAMVPAWGDEMDGTVAALRRLAEAEPTSLEVQRRLAHFLVTTKKANEAREVIERWSKANGPDEELSETLYHALVEIGEPRAARAALIEAQRLNPRHVQRGLWLGASMAHDGDVVLADATLQRTWDATADPRIGEVRLGLALHRGDATAACARYDELLEHAASPEALLGTNHRLITDADATTREAFLAIYKRLDFAPKNLPPGGRAAWAQCTIEFMPTRRAIETVFTRLTDDDHRRDAAHGLAQAACWRQHPRLADILFRDHLASFTSSASLLALADALWIAERLPAITTVLDQWDERTDASAAHCELAARIRLAIGDFDDAPRVTARGIVVADSDERDRLRGLEGFAHLFAGRVGDATPLLAEVRDGEGDVGALAAWALDALDAAAEPPARPATAYRQLRTRLVELKKEHPSPLTTRVAHAVLPIIGPALLGTLRWKLGRGFALRPFPELTPGETSHARQRHWMFDHTFGVRRAVRRLFGKGPPRRR